MTYWEYIVGEKIFSETDFSGVHLDDFQHMRVVGCVNYMV